MKVDLHVHSIYSERPSEWILKTIGTKESYTDPDFIYQTAIKNGMDFVTITDHNKIGGIMKLLEKYPEKVFSGVEFSTYFPEDGCKIHLLTYGFTKKQFEEMNILRSNIYDLREYIKKHNIAHSVAHATYSTNSKLQLWHLEKLILLFDVFETINGGRSQRNNKTWAKVLTNLTPDHISKLVKKYDIEPFSDTPWIKGFTGGSDDHAGLFIGKTYTKSNGNTVQDFINSLKKKESISSGRHNTYKALAFAIYKIGYDFTKANNIELSKPFLQHLNDILFERKDISFKQKIFMKSLKKKYRDRNMKTREIMLDIVNNNLQNQKVDIDLKIKNIYNDLADLSDQYFTAVIESFVKDSEKIDLINIFQKLSSSLFGIFLTIPFISTLMHIFQDRKLHDQLEDEFIPHLKKKQKDILWFTDTLTDLNGVSVTLRKIGWLASQKNKSLKIVSSLLKTEITDELPPNIELLPVSCSFTPKIYDSYTIKVPSVLKSIKMIYEMNPDEIIISTPGPVGIIGLIAGKIMQVKTRIIYHTDFAQEADKVLKDGNMVSLIDAYLRWFYNLNDEILVPTYEYINMLEDRQWERNKMKLFRRGLDIAQFNPKPSGKDFIVDHTGLKSGTNLIYTGRISEDKNVDFLLNIYKEVLKEHPETNLLMLGDGPYRKSFEKKCKELDRVFFTGKISQTLMPYFYSGADLLVFPSTTDTFGMSVLESLACGTPAFVSDIGGPKEIIVDKETGRILNSKDITVWIKEITEFINTLKNQPEKIIQINQTCRTRVIEKYNWDILLDELLS